ncbi:glycosyltransferase family 22 protein [Amanita muscaria]
MSPIAFDLFLLSIVWIHVFLAPYTKVEESFNLHATHDVLMYGVGPNALKNYDHFTFPGAVPRTFLGSVLLAWLSTPVIALANKLGFVSSKFDLQIIVRLVLATLNTAGLCYMRRAISRRFSYTTSALFVLLTCSQFHLPFWMGRTLPNMFALLPVNISTSLLIGHNPVSVKQSKRAHKAAIALLSFTAVVFRAEIALLLAPLSFQLLFTRKLTVLELIKVGLYSGVTSIALTILVDSYFWQTFPLWPELHGIYFNVYEGKSVEWGISPPLTYIKNYLPKLLLGSLPLACIGAILDNRITSLLFPSLLFIALISCLGHKEWRFVIYVVPIFNLAAARAASFLIFRKPPLLRRAFILATTGIITANLLITIVFALSSIYNYPGGEAMTLLHKLYPAFHKPTPHVHISNLAAQTGASLFLHLNAPPYLAPYFLSDQPFRPRSFTWIYNKTEHLDERTIALSHEITHVISEGRPSRPYSGYFAPIATVLSFDRWSVDRAFLGKLGYGFVTKPEELTKGFRMVKSGKLWILERTNK